MSYIICFWDKSKLQVSDLTAKILKQAISEEVIKTFEIVDSLYAVGGVEKIIPKDEAYEVFPAEFERLKSLEDKTVSLPQIENSKPKQLS